MAQSKKKILQDKGRANIVDAQKERHGVTLSTIDKDRNHNTRDEISKELGWSTGKVAMADKVWKEAKPEIKEKIKLGELKNRKAYNNKNAERCKIKWFRNKWMTYPVQNEISELKYWTS